MVQGKTGKAREQILAAAAVLFAQLGYTGVSTREIARMAQVNEITVYRYYPRKRELFMAALESEVQKLHLRPELVTQLVNAPDLRTSLESICELISDVLMQQPGLARLVQFGALEFGPALIPLYRRHLAGVVDLGIEYLQRWVDSGDLRAKDPRMLILAFSATIVSLPTFYSAIWQEQLPVSADQNLAAFYAGLWHRVLADERTGERGC